MSAGQHRFRHLTDQDYHRLLAEGTPLSVPPDLRHFQAAGPDADAAPTLPSHQPCFHDPATGRWTSQNPLEFDRSEDNLYGSVPRHTSACDLGLDDAPAPRGFEWTGRALEIAEDLQYNRPRSYDPTPGVWLAEDGQVIPAK